LQLNPQKTSALNLRGLIKSSMHNEKDALIDFNMAIEIDSTDAISYANRGTSKIELKDYEGAIEDYNNAIKNNPDYASAYYLRGLSEAYLKRDGCPDFRKAIDLGFKKDDDDSIKKYCH